MKQKSKIGYSNYYLPAHKMAVEDLVNTITNSPQEYEQTLKKIAQKIGTPYIYKEKRENELAIFKDMIIKYFEAKNLEPDAIDYIFYNNTLGASGNDEILYSIQHDLKLSKVNLINIGQGCSGTITAIKIADAIIKDNSAENILILSNCFMNDDQERYISTAIVSDALGILEVTAHHGEFEVLDYIVKTDGSINEKNFVVEGTPIKIVKTGANLISKLLKNNNLSLEQIKTILPVNTNTESFEYYANFLRCNLDKFYLDNISDGGHLGNVDSIRNISDAISRKIIQKDDLIILYALGIGTQWVAMLLKKI